MLDPMDFLKFDPHDVSKLFRQDALIEEYGPTAGPGVSMWEIRQKPDANLRSFIADLRNARLLPLNTGFVRGIQTILGYSEAERDHRARKAAKARVGARRAKASGREDYASIKARTRIEDVFDRLCGEPGTGRGDHRWYRCPFHQGDRTPSLEVTLSRQLFHCFGCGVGGDAITLFQRKELRDGGGAS